MSCPFHLPFPPLPPLPPPLAFSTTFIGNLKPKHLVPISAPRYNIYQAREPCDAAAYAVAITPPGLPTASSSATPTPILDSFQCHVVQSYAEQVRPSPALGSAARSQQSLAHSAPSMPCSEHGACRLVGSALRLDLPTRVPT